MTYPKARAALTWAVYTAANERAERWRVRTEQARKERDALQARLDELEK